MFENHYKQVTHMSLQETPHDYGRAEHPNHGQLSLGPGSIATQKKRMLLRGTQHDYGSAEHPDHNQL